MAGFTYRLRFMKGRLFVEVTVFGAHLEDAIDKARKNCRRVRELPGALVTRADLLNEVEVS